MKRNILSTSILILVSVIFGYGQSNSWKNLTPLFSNRSDVEKLLGKSTENKYSSCRNETPNGDVSVSYAAGECKEGWNVQKDTVLSLSVSYQGFFLQ